jgi:hypothetical protein
VRPQPKQTTPRFSSIRPLVASAFILGGLNQLALPLLAEGTPANTTISNTATATYEDPNDTGKSLNAVSNTVQITVAEVAGITITAGSVTGGSGTSGAIVAGDTVNYGFTITNVGNDTTRFQLPGTATTAGPGTFQKVQYLDPADNTWKDVSVAGSQIVAKDATGNGFAPGESLQVRVLVTISAGATSGQNVTVTLGKTPVTGDQNITYTPDGADVFTVDAADGTTGETSGAPINGIREASQSLAGTVGAAAKPVQAFATILKSSSYDPGTSTTTLADDRINYTLKLRVEGTSPDAAKEAGDLAASNITLNGTANTKKVLVSDAIPAGTTIVSASAPAGSGWTVVYTTDAVTGAGAKTADQANWQTGTIPTDGSVTRVGFIADGPIAKGTTQDNLNLTVKLTDGTVATATVANIAQVIGSTKDPTTGTAGTDTVYDESGDQNPNNYEGGTAPGTNTITDGVANPTTDGTDPGNNTGTGSGGESNVVSLDTNALGVLNGPTNAPSAVGPTSNNDDFTNRTVAIDPTQAATLQFNTDGTPKAGTGLINPAAQAFGNTLQNTSSTSKTFTLVPNGNPDNTLPNGTTATITNAAGNTATYTFNSTTGDWTTTATPVTVTVAPGATANYSVQVDLPANTDQLKGYGVAIVAYIDNDGTAGLSSGDTQNTTIDRVYTGYLKLKKEARILSSDGNTTIQDWTTDNTLLKVAKPNDRIEYRITYENISKDAPAGSSSIELNARNVTIVEDGAAGGNTWATTTNHVAGTVVKASNATVTYSPTNSDSDPSVTKYTYTVTSDLTPGVTGQFQFTRQVK